MFLLRRDGAGGATPEFIAKNKEDFTERIDWTVENYDRDFGKHTRDDLPASDEWEEFPGMIVSKRHLSSGHDKEFLSAMLQMNEAHFAKYKELEKPPEVADLVEGL